MRIFRQKRDIIVEGWRKMNNEELRNLYFSPNIILMIKSRMMRWSGNVARMGQKRNAHRTLVEKPDGRRPLVRQRRRCVGNIKMDLREIGWGSVDWIHLDQDSGFCEYGNKLLVP
jgi:hypothetical protein